MKSPTIHSGGTSREDLFEAVMVARAALLKAIIALSAIYPDGRDYAEHEERSNKLHLVMGELNAMAIAIQDF